MKHSLGVLLLGGGNLFGKAFDGEVNANFGRLAPAIHVGKKYVAFMLGTGVAFSRLSAGDTTLRDLGLAVPA